jgi:hypothetical protein
MTKKKLFMLIVGLIFLALVCFLILYTFSNPFKPNKAITIAPVSESTTTKILATIPWKYPALDGSCLDVAFSWTCLVESYAPRAITFSPHGNMVVYKIDGPHSKYFVLNDMKGHDVGDRSGIELSKEYLEKVIFSPDGTTIAYLIHRDGKTALSINETPTNFYDAVSLPDFSSDGKHIGYITLNGYDDYHAVIDGKVSAQYEMIAGKEIDDHTQHISFSNDGKHALFIGGKNGKNYVVVDGVEIEKEKFDIKKYPFFISEDPFLDVASGMYFYRLDGEIKSSQFKPVVSPDKNHVAILNDIKIHQNKNERDTLLVDDIAIDTAPYQIIYSLVFSPDSSKLLLRAAKVASTGYVYVVVDLITGKQTEVKAEEFSEAIGLTNNSEIIQKVRNAVSGRPQDEYEYIQIGERKGKKYDVVINPIISPDGKYVRYGAREGRDLLWVVEKIDTK